MVERTEIDENWIRVHREAIQNYGQPARASPIGNAIELKSLRDNTWRRIELPNRQSEFVSAAVRDEVLDLLVGKSRA